MKYHLFIVLFFQLKYCSSSAILNVDAIEEKLNKISENYENIDEKFDSVYQTISDTKDSLTILIDNSINSLSERFEIFKEDISDKLDDKVKREQRGRFVTEADFDIITKKIDQLEYLPQNLTDAVTNTYSDISKDIKKTTITKDEFASFQLSVVRDTSHLRYQEGEWVLFQQRGQFGNPEDYFARDMREYVVGFGDPSKEFWLGLDKLVSLTKNGAELWIEIETFEGKKIHAKYSSFKVEGPEYRIHVSGYSGNAGDPMRIDNGMAFSARDNDKDLWIGDCSKTRGYGGWWYNGCGLANLNGMNLGSNQKSYDGILWYFYGNDNRCFKASQMKLRKI